MTLWPALVAHADWSTGPAKRWMTTAQLLDGRYESLATEPVGETTSLLSRLRDRARGMPFMIGFDFPIGLPQAYAERAGITSFLDALSEFGGGRWARFYDLAETADEISLLRPFYPYRPGGTSQQHLVAGLGVDDIGQLLRICDRSTTRPAACSVFWTLGANQVGRAAISGWREVLLPALERVDMRVAVWPFYADLNAAFESVDCVIAETYPAEACLHLGLSLSGLSKARQTDRQSLVDSLLGWAASRPEVSISSGLEREIRDGFSPDRSGEDRFDATVGLCSMLDVVTGRRRGGAPRSSPALSVEGWILGQG